jgi:choline kinase
MLDHPLRDAVILAAGKGSRLRGSDDDLPKPLFTVRGVPLIKRTILTLARAGVRRVVIVTGFMAERISAAVNADPDYARAGVEIVLAHNPEFEKSNGLSVIVGARAVGGPFLLSMADHIYTPVLARSVAACDMRVADLFLATDVRLRNVLDIDDATKVRTEGGKIVDIGKHLTSYDRIDCGVFAATTSLAGALLAARAKSANDDCSLSDGVRQLASRGRARVVDIGTELWQDVDTSEDREFAQRALEACDPFDSP